MIRTGDELGYLYIATTADRKAIKIGFTANPQQRAKTLQFEQMTQEHGGIRFVAYMPGTLDTERTLHAELSAYQMRKRDKYATDWYERRPEVCRAIRLMRPSLLPWSFGPRLIRVFVDCPECGMSAFAFVDATHGRYSVAPVGSGAQAEANGHDHTGSD